MRPISFRINCIFVHFKILKLRTLAASDNAPREIHIFKSSATDKWSDRFEAGVGRGKGSNHSPHGKARETDFIGIYFGLLFQESNRPATRHRKENPIGVPGTGNRVD